MWIHSCLRIMINLVFLSKIRNIETWISRKMSFIIRMPHTFSYWVSLVLSCIYMNTKENQTMFSNRSASDRVSTIPTHTTPLRLTAIDFQLFFICPLWKMTIHASLDFNTLSVKFSPVNGKISKNLSSGSNAYVCSSSPLSWQAERGSRWHRRARYTATDTDIFKKCRNMTCLSVVGYTRPDVKFQNKLLK